MRALRFATKPATPVLWAGLALVLLGLAPAATRADVIIGNLGAVDGGNVSLSATNYEAVSFTMGSQAYSVSDVQIRILGNGNLDAITFQMRDNAGGQPSNSVLFTFDGQSASFNGTNTLTFGAGSPFTLTANSTYWLVGFSSNGNAKWVDSSPLTPPAGSGATFGQYSASTNSGTNWSSDPSDAPKFQLDGTPSVGSPEPSSLLLTGTAACMAAAFGWRRRRSRHPKPPVVTAPSADGT